MAGWTDRPADWGRPGHNNTGLEAATVLDGVEAGLGRGWVDISSTFVIGAVTTPPTKGNSTYVVTYRRPGSTGTGVTGFGDLVHVNGYVLIGSTFSAGSGVYRFPVPFNASANAILAACGSVFVFDNTTANRCGTCVFGSATWVELYVDGSASALTHAGSGTAWATGDIIRWSIAYEPA